MSDVVLMTVEELCRAVKGRCIGSNAGGFSSVCTDSRNAVKGALFVPLMGEFRDGHNYIPQAVDNGAEVILIDENHEAEIKNKTAEGVYPGNVSFVVVENTLKGLQDAAAGYLRKFPGLLKIGITGSCGKTTTKEIFGAVFSVKYRVVMTEGNFNSETGLPLSVFNVRDFHQVGIFEAGMNRSGEIKELAAVLKPDFAVITNIGTAHIGILGSKDRIAEEKKSIFSFFDEKSVGLIPLKDEYHDYLKSGVPGKILSFGDGCVEEIAGVRDLGLRGTEFVFKNGEKAVLSIPGYYNYINALAAIKAAFEFGFTIKEVAEGINSVKPLFGRSQVFTGVVGNGVKKQNITLVQDCYNANPQSLKAGIKLCDSENWDGKRIYVVGAMKELGADSYSYHCQALESLKDSKADWVFAFGEEFKKPVADMVVPDSRIIYSDNIDGLISGVREKLTDDTLLFVKGSRAMALERLGKALGVVPGCEGEQVCLGK